MRKISWLTTMLLLSCRGGSSEPSKALDPQGGPASSVAAPETAPSPSPSAPAPVASASTVAVDVPFPVVRTDCKTDADCVGIAIASDCCAHCGHTVGNRAWATDVSAYCTDARKKDLPECPKRKCPFDDYEAKCVKSVCTKILK